MSDVALIAIKAVMGGLFVVAFSLIAEVVRPKRFAGLFAAAPAVAFASMLITVVVKGPEVAATMSRGMLIGSAGMLAYCLCCLFTIGRLRALLGSLTAWIAWFAVAGLLAVAIGG